MKLFLNRNSLFGYTSKKEKNKYFLKQWCLHNNISLIVHCYEWHWDWTDWENCWVEMMLAEVWCLANWWTLVLDDSLVYMKLLWERECIIVSALQDWIWQSFQKTFIARCVSLKKRCQYSELVLQIPQSRSDPLHRWSMGQEAWKVTILI